VYQLFEAMASARTMGDMMTEESSANA
jgi:hypothetical protein